MPNRSSDKLKNVNFAFTYHLNYRLDVQLAPTCRKMERFNLPIACSMVRKLPVKISPIHLLKNDTLFMKH